MGSIKYIVSISGSKPLPKDEASFCEPVRLDMLVEKFGTVGFARFPFRLYEKGFDEKKYAVKTDKNNPLTHEEIKEFEEAYAKEKRIIKFYRLNQL